MTERLSRRGRGPRRPLPEPDPQDWPVTLLRPRTLGPYGRPEPVIIPPLEAWNDPGYEPVSGIVPAIPADGGLGDDIDQPETPVPGGASLLRTNLVVASGTAVSRLTGLLRTFILFWVLARDLSDAYVLANNTPNMIYELILGGILTATLVPLFTDDLERGDGQEATSAIISVALVALVVVTLLGLVVGPADHPAAPPDHRPRSPGRLPRRRHPAGAHLRPADLLLRADGRLVGGAERAPAVPRRGVGTRAQQPHRHRHAPAPGRSSASGAGPGPARAAGQPDLRPPATLARPRHPRLGIAPRWGSP